MNAIALAVTGAATTNGACPGNLYWSATAAAPGQSVMAGVLAGFVFLGIVTVLSVRSKARRPATSALKLLFSAFFGLAVVAYLFADQAGDGLCVRVYAEETLNGGILGTFAVIMLVSLTWLVVAYDLYSSDTLRFLRVLVYFASAFVVLLLCTSSYTYVVAVTSNGFSDATAVFLYVIGALFWIAAVVRGFVSEGWLRARTWRRNGHDDVRDLAARPRAPRRGLVDWSCWAALGYLAVASVTDSVVLAVPNSAWDATPRPVVDALAWGSLLLPLAVLFLALRGLAPEPTRKVHVRARTAALVNARTTALADSAAKNVVEQVSAVTVDRRLLEARFETYIVSHYTSLHNTVVSVVLAVAGLSAASLLGARHQDGGSYALFWLLWAASFLLCVAIFGGTMIGALVMPPLMPTMTDLVIPMLLGIGQFVLFGVLARQATEISNPGEIIEAWYIVLVAVCLCAALAVNRAIRFFKGAIYPADIAGAINRYRAKRLPRDVVGALFGAALAVIGAIAASRSISWLENVIAYLFIGVLLLVLAGHAKSARILRSAAAFSVSAPGSSRNNDEASEVNEGAVFPEEPESPAKPTA